MQECVKGRLFPWEKDFTRRMVTIALPIAVQNLVSASLHVVDGIMIAGLGTTAYAGVTQAGRYSFLFQLFLFGAASGSAIFTSQFWGNKNIDGIRRTISLCLRVMGGLAVLFMLGALLFPYQIMGLLIQNKDCVEYGAEYLMLVAPSYLFAAIDLVFSNCLRSTEKPVVPMMAGIVSIGVNTVLNYCLIHGIWIFPELGVRGAAIATVIASFVSLLVNAGYTYRRHQPGAIKLRELKMPDSAFCISYIRRVLPVVLNEGLWSLGMTVYSVFYGHIGEDAAAAVNMYNTVDQLMTVFVFGVVNACAILIGKDIGANQCDRAKLTAKRMLVTVVMLSALTGFGLILLRRPILSLFSDLSEKALESAMEIMLFAGLIMPIRHINMVNIVGILRAGGDTVFSMILDAGCVWAVGVPIVGLTSMVLNWPIEFVYLSTVVEELVKVSLGVPRFLSGKWINNVTHRG